MTYLVLMVVGARRVLIDLIHVSTWERRIARSWTSPNGTVETVWSTLTRVVVTQSWRADHCS
jgi:hypothetical protein